MSVEVYYDEAKSRWKWLVLAGSFLNQAIVYGLTWGSGGVFQVIFMHAFGGPGQAARISVIPTIPPAILSFIGPFVSALCNRFGKRKVMWLGTVLIASGMFLSAFANSVPMLYLTFTIFGLGGGCIYIPSVVIVCDYFVKLRPLTVGVAGAGVSVGIFIFPMLIRYLDDHYGWRGACILISAITLHIGISSTIFKDVHTVERGLAAFSVKTGKKKILRVKMLRHLPIWCFLLNHLLCLYGMMAFFSHMPAHAESLGYSKRDSAFFVAIGGITSTINRLFYGILIQKFNHPMAVHMISMAFAGVAVASIPFLTSHWSILSACAIYGFGSASLGPTFPLILAELVGSEGINDALGYTLVAEGLGSMLGPPFSGYLYDTLGSYSWSLCLAGSALILASAAMIIPYNWVVQQHKRATAMIILDEIIPPEDLCNEPAARLKPSKTVSTCISKEEDQAQEEIQRGIETANVSFHLE